eukprot:3935223-Rhodomonas_salina.3
MHWMLSESSAGQEPSHCHLRLTDSQCSRPSPQHTLSLALNLNRSCAESALERHDQGDPQRDPAGGREAGRSAKLRAEDIRRAAPSGVEDRELHPRAASLRLRLCGRVRLDARQEHDRHARVRFLPALIAQTPVRAIPRCPFHVEPMDVRPGLRLRFRLVPLHRRHLCVCGETLERPLVLARGRLLHRRDEACWVEERPEPERVRHSLGAPVRELVDAFEEVDEPCPKPFQ